MNEKSRFAASWRTWQGHRRVVLFVTGIFGVPALFLAGREKLANAPRFLGALFIYKRLVDNMASTITRWDVLEGVWRYA
jgi:hypothetical protein